MLKEYVIRGDEPNTGLLDFSELLEAPSGRHGFLKATPEGHLAFEDGTAFRAFGVNTVGAGGMPDHDAAQCTAARLASAGINFVRLHFMDGTVDIGRKDYKEDLFVIDYSHGNSRELNESALERLDYFLYCLKSKGIYIQLDTLVTRNFDPVGDELDYPDAFPEGWSVKCCTIFNRRLIDLQKEFQTKFLHHRNPYTGLCYADDPVVAVVQVMNENSLLWNFGATFNMDIMPAPYRRELQEKWRLWLKGKYKTNEALQDAWTDMFGDCALESVEHLDFAVQMPAKIFQTHRIVGAEHDDRQCSADSQTRMSDFVEFLMELEISYAREMYTHLRSIGVKCLINTTNLVRGPANVYTSTRWADVAEQDSYYNHPTCGFVPPAKVSRLPMLAVDPRDKTSAESESCLIIPAIASAKVKDKPIIAAEWNVVNATPFSADGVLQMAAYGSLQDWDGMLNFQYGAGRHISDYRSEELTFYFISNNDPAMWPLFGVGSYVFQKHLVQPGINTVNICYTQDDLKANPDEPSMIPFCSLPYITRVQAAFGEQFHEEKGAVHISSGFTPTGDYGSDPHAIVFSDSPYADLHHKAYGREENLRRNAGSCCVEDASAFSRKPARYAQTVVGKLSDWGMLPDGSGLQGSALISDTGEVCLDPARKQFAVQTPMFACFAGEPAGEIRMTGFRFDIDNRIMSVTLLSRDYLPLEESASVLLTCIGETTNTGREFRDEWIVDLGHAPVLVDQVSGTLRIPHNGCRVTVYPLDSRGGRRAPLPVQRDGSYDIVFLETESAAVHYEISRVQEG